MATAEDIFRDAQSQFRQSLSPEQLSYLNVYEKAGDMLTDIGILGEHSEHHPRFNRGMKKIESFNKALQPYFEVVNICVQSHPEYAALLWGAARLTVLLASNYVTFFEKLAKFLERIAEKLKRYEDIYTERETQRLGKSDRLRYSLSKIYEGLLHFLQAVIRVYTKESGAPKRTARIIGGLLWKPFDVRFRELLENIDAACATFKEELEFSRTWMDMQRNDEVTKDRVLAQEERKLAASARTILEKSCSQTDGIKRTLMDQQIENTFRRGQAWLAPPDYAQEYENKKKSRDVDTGQWIFEEPSFCRWLESDQLGDEHEDARPRLLTVQGKPGSGKSTLAASTIGWLSDVESSNAHSIHPTYYFFFRHEFSTANHSHAALRAILAQICSQLRHDQQILDAFAFAMEENPSGQLRATGEELEDLMHAIMCILDRGTIVVDAVDECEDSIEFIRTIESLMRHNNFKILLFCRPVLPSTTTTIPAETLEIANRNEKDIEIFLRRQINELVPRYLPGDANKEVLLSLLLLGADGMFLWARLMMSYLRSPALSKSRRVKEIMKVTFPEGLEVMYDRLIGLINKKPRIEKRLATLVLSLASFSTRPLTSVEYLEAIKSSGEYDFEGPEFQEAVILSCSALVERTSIQDPRYDTPRPAYQLIHLTAREYFQMSSRSFSHGGGSISVENAMTAISAINANSHIANLCLRYLTYHLPAQPLGGSLGTKIDQAALDISFPFSNYAALSWFKHFGILSKMESTNQDLTLENSLQHFYRDIMNALTQFLGHGFVLMSWIEACYTYGQRPLFEGVVDWLAFIDARCNLRDRDSNFPQLLQDARDFKVYLDGLEEDWGTKLSISPSTIWEEVTAFTPSRLLPQTTSTFVKSLSADKPRTKELCSQHLCKISECSSDGRWVFVLSVWPSRQYSRLRIEPCISMHDIRRACSGWVARLECWTSDMSSKRWGDVKLPLDANEIWLHTCHSLWCSPQSADKPDWKLPFPLAIHPTGHYITVLRTLYSLQLSANEGTRNRLRLESRLLPLTIHSPHLTSNSLDDANPEFDIKTGQCEIYRYWISFSSNGRYLSLIESFPAQRVDVTVAELFTEKTFSVKVVSRAELPKIHDPFSAEIPRATFHKKRPIMAFTLDHRGYMFEFDKGVRRISQCQARFPNIKRVAFAECGQFLVIDDSFSDTPVLRRLPEEKNGPGEAPETTIPDSFARCEPLDRGEVQLRNLSSKSAIIRDVDSGLTINSQSFHLSALADGAITFSKRSSNGAVDMVELTKLPNWVDLQSSNIAAKLPQNSRDMVHIVINKAEEAWYSTGNTPDNRLPLIISRDQKALSMRSAASFKRNRALEDEESYAAKRNRR